MRVPKEGRGDRSTARHVEYSPYARPSTPRQKSPARSNTPSSILQRAKSWLTPWRRPALASSQVDLDTDSSEIVATNAEKDDIDMDALESARRGWKNLRNIHDRHQDILADQSSLSVAAEPPSEVHFGDDAELKAIDDSTENHSMNGVDNPVEDGATQAPPNTRNSAMPVDESEHSNENEMLARFFQERGDRPLNMIEYEGVLSLLSKVSPRSSVSRQSPSLSRHDPLTPVNAGSPYPTRTPQTASSFSTDGKVYQPIFTSQRTPKFHIGSSTPQDVKLPANRPRFYGPTQSSPFRRKRLSSARAFNTNSFQQDQRALTESLGHEKGVTEKLEGDKKRDLEENLVPQAKRQQVEASHSEPQAVPRSQSKTAASILSIIGEQPAHDTTPKQASTESYVSPYAQSTFHKTSQAKSPQSVKSTPRSMPQKRTAIEDVERSVRYSTPKSSSKKHDEKGPSALSPSDYPPSLRSFLPSKSSPSVSASKLPSFKPSKSSGLSHELASPSSKETDSTKGVHNEHPEPPKMSTSNFAKQPEEGAISGARPSEIPRPPAFGTVTDVPKKQQFEAPKSSFTFQATDTKASQSSVPTFGTAPETPSFSFGAKNAFTGRAEPAKAPAADSAKPVSFSFNQKPAEPAAPETTKSFSFGFKPTTEGAPNGGPSSAAVQDISKAGGPSSKESEHDVSSEVTETNAQEHEEPKGFVFKPSADASRMKPAFSLDGFDKSSSTSATTGKGFVFEPHKSVEPVKSKSMSAIPDVQERSKESQNKLQVAQPDAQSKALLVDQDSLPQFRFTALVKSDVHSGPLVEVMNMKDSELPASHEFSFTPMGVPSGGNAKNSGPQLQSHSSWASIGFQMPSKPAGSWECPVCMITNKAEASQCAACETPK